MTALTDTMEILTKVNEFYDSAWNKLLIIGSLIGIVFPVVINWYQNKSLTLQKTELEDKITNEINTAKDTIKNELVSVLEEKIGDYEKQIKKTTDRLTGFANHLNASNIYDKKDYTNAFENYIYAISYYINTDENINLQRCLEYSHICLDKLPETDKENLISENFFNLENYLNEIEEKKETSFLNKDIKALRRIIAKIKK